MEVTLKCSKLKWNHEQQVVVSLQSFEHLDVIFMVNKRIDHGKFSPTCVLKVLQKSCATERKSYHT